MFPPPSRPQPEDYTFTNQSGCNSVRGMDDARDYQEVCHAMQTVGMTADEVQEVWRVVALVLALGNVDFYEADTDKVGFVVSECPLPT